MDYPEHGHDPVMLDETMAALALAPGTVAVDCTVGRGGHAAEMARRIAPDGQLLALDADPVNLAFARDRLRGGPAPARFFHANFSEVSAVLAEIGQRKVDALLADLGVSTNQLLDSQRGMSFTGNAPLDMRLDPDQGESAADLLAHLSEEQLADIFFHHAQERYARRIARKIVQTRAREPIRTTEQLVRIIRSATPGDYQHQRLDPATRTFQGLRMAVNAEPDHLRALLKAIPAVMQPGGRVAIISFHSGEDRLVKQAMRGWAQEGRGTEQFRKPREAAEPEVARNPRSRSAKLRAFTMQ